MHTKEILHLTTRLEWRDWLKKNFNIKQEVWIAYPKKSTGKPRILYNDAVEEALCFGWIDSINKTLDTHHTIQRFTPRKSKNKYSQANIERLKYLVKHHLICNEILKQVEKIVLQEFIFPDDILDEIKKDKMAWVHYANFSDSYKRIRIAYINDARKRTDEFKKRLNNFIQKTRENKLIIGFGGIDKYY